MTNTDRSPIKRPPLRNPGQSVEETRRKLVEDKLESPALMAVLLVALAAMEWWRSFFGIPPKPVLFSVIAAVAVAFVAWRRVRLSPDLRALKQAAEGERAVGQFLEALREQGYKVFHDVVSAGFNVDHVIIGPAGVYSVETKTWSKPRQGEARISFDGEKLRAAGLEPDRNPLIQAVAQAGWLRDLLAESTGRVFEVRPVILFPGWFIEPPLGGMSRVWVLNPKALPAFLEHQKARLSAEDVALASTHLAKYIRAGEARGYE